MSDRVEWAGKPLRRLVIILLLLVAFGLRCAGLDAQELRGDEAFGYFFSLHPLREVVDQTLELSEPHPVASYWLQHGWLGAAGHSEFALRFVGVWWSVLAVALVVPLAGQLALPSSAALAATALLAFSPYAIWHAQDARMYSMSLALTMASSLLALRWWGAQGRGRIGAAVGYLLVTWLALNTHYFALYIVAAQNLALLGWAVAERTWRKLALWWGVGLLLLLMWLPWLLAAWAILLDYRGNGDSPGLIDALVRAFSSFAVGEAVAMAWRVWAALLLLAMVTWGSLSLWNKGARRSLWFLAVYLLVPLAATWLSALNRPIFNERYLVAAIPPVYLLAAAGFGRVEARPRWLVWLGRGALAALLVAMLIGYVRQSTDPLYSKSRGWRELAVVLEHLSAGMEPSRVRLAQNYPDPTLWYYYRGAVAHLVLPPAARDAARAGEEVERLVDEGVGRVILVEQPSASWDDRGIAYQSLERSYELAETMAMANWPVSLWLRPTTPFNGATVAYEDGLELAGSQVEQTNGVAGGAVAVHLRWQQDETAAAAPPTVSVQVLDASGALVAQSDRALEMASDTTALVSSYAILLPLTLPSGGYQVVVVVYDPSLPGAPRRLTTDGADTIRLGSISVAASASD